MMSPAAAPAHEWHHRANEAARSVTALYGGRLFFLPGTHIAAVQWPAPSWREGLRNKPLRPWHYWWQAHYVDCLVDAGRRELGRGAVPPARFNGPGQASAGRTASRLVTGIRLRNALTYVNDYYDDMAWLALATLRLDELAEETRKPGRRRNSAVRESLTLQFDEAASNDLGGGVFWSKKRDFKNTPATAPVALFYARTGQRSKAQALLDWLDATLFDPARGLYLDGARLDPAGDVTVESTVYTYNQGPVLGALLDLGGDANLVRAATLVHAVERHLTVPVAESPAVLRCEGTGDGGLFTGILCRYLALAAVDARLSGSTRATAARLVTATAQAFWDGKRQARPGADSGKYIFSLHAAEPAASTLPPGAVVDLSTQLQAWMTLEAAAYVAASSSGPLPAR